MIYLRGQILGIKALRNIRIGNNGMQGQVDSNLCYGVHKVSAESAPLFVNGGIRIKANRFAVVNLLQARRNVHGDKGNCLSGFPVIEPGKINELFLKSMDDVIVFIVALGEDYHAAALTHELHGFSKSCY